MSKLPTFKYADISTAHVTAEDARLMGQDNAPCVLAQIKGGDGTIFYVSSDDPNDMLKQFTAYGFSSAFCQVMARAVREKIPYVCFDGDGSRAEDLPVFDW